MGTIGGRRRGGRAAGAAGRVGALGLALALAASVACSAPAASPSAPAANAAGGAASGASGTAGSPAAAAPVTLTYAATTLGWNLVPTIISQEKGFFAAEGLTVETAITGQSAAVCQQVLARAAEIGGCSLSDTMQTIEASGGAPLEIIMQETTGPLHNGLIVRPDMTSYADLKGKTVMLGGPKDNTVYFFKTMARANGVQDDDYDITYAGSSSARYAALQAGGVAASLLTDPFDYRIEQEGFRRLDNLRPKYLNPGNYAGNGHVVHKDWARDHGEILVRYIRAALGAAAWMADPANEEEMFAILGPKINLTRDTFQRSYDRGRNDPEWSLDGRANPAAYEGVQKSLVELGVLQEPLPPPSKYYDMTYVEQAHQSMGR
ncbi:MAG TPA: ABC transporter substrate-binding protein [Chloroflexota bacterium]|nr:ABC transporter substrate-binding protein [Chloroflexota bacterium]